MNNQQCVMLRYLVEDAINSWPDFEDDSAPISGSDMVDWYCEWRQRALIVLETIKDTAARVG